MTTNMRHRLSIVIWALVFTVLGYNSNQLNHLTMLSNHDTMDFSPSINKNSGNSYAYFAVSQLFTNVVNGRFSSLTANKVMEMTVQNITAASYQGSIVFVNISSALYGQPNIGTNGDAVVAVPVNVTLHYNVVYPYPTDNDYVFYYELLAKSLVSSVSNDAFNQIYAHYCLLLKSGLLHSKSTKSISVSYPSLLLPRSNSTVLSTASTSSSSSSNSDSVISSLNPSSIIIICILSVVSFISLVVFIIYMGKRRQVKQALDLSLKEFSFADIYHVFNPTGPTASNIAVGSKKLHHMTSMKELMALKGATCPVCKNKIRTHHQIVELENEIFHEDCATCVECDCDLNSDNFTQHQGENGKQVLLCKTHWHEKFPDSEYIPKRPVVQETLDSDDQSVRNTDDTPESPSDTQRPTSSQDGKADTIGKVQSEMSKQAVSHKVDKHEELSKALDEAIRLEEGFPPAGVKRSNSQQQSPLSSSDSKNRSHHTKNNIGRGKHGSRDRDADDNYDDDGYDDRKQQDMDSFYRSRFPPVYNPYSGSSRMGDRLGAIKSARGPFGALGFGDPYFEQMAMIKALDMEAQRIASELDAKRLAEQAEIKRKATELEIQQINEEREAKKREEEKLRMELEKRKTEAEIEVKRMFEEAERQRKEQEAEVKKIAQELVAQKLAEQAEFERKQQEEEAMRLALEAQAKRELNELYERKRIAFEKAFERKMMMEDQKLKDELQRKLEFEGIRSRQEATEMARTRAFEEAERKKAMDRMLSELGVPKLGAGSNKGNQQSYGSGGFGYGPGGFP